MEEGSNELICPLQLDRDVVNTRFLFDGEFLNTFYENIDGISDHKIPDLNLSSSSCDYHVIVFTETWLDSNIKNEILDKRYTIFRRDRSSTSISQTASKGGGVLIAIRSNIECNTYTNNMMKDLEAICVRIQTKSGFIYSTVLIFNHQRRLTYSARTLEQLNY